MEVQAPRQMAYDRAIVVFSPEGRMYQVEYARKAVNKAMTILGIVFKGGVALVATKQTGKLIVSNKDEKISMVDNHIIAGTCGILADSRVLIDFARIKAQINRITYDEPIEINALVKELADRNQRFTQVAGLRPYGVSLLISGSSNGEPHLYETDPSGTIREWKAHAIGRGAAKAAKALEEQYKEGMTKEQAVALGIKALKEGEEVFSAHNVEIGIVEDGIARILDKNEVREFLK
ncbi:MAG: archaeal proteasome endopeptidase complex subunit alpha [Candidatus Aenigmatarchaeota archaeon]